jgi:hypothetical protein
MAKKQHGKGGKGRHGDGGGHGGNGDHDKNGDHGGYEREPYDDPNEHREIERRRFVGGLPPTTELYARAREQWYRLPGALARPAMDPPANPPGSPPASDQAPSPKK